MTELKEMSNHNHLKTNFVFDHVQGLFPWDFSHFRNPTILSKMIYRNWWKSKRLLQRTVPAFCKEKEDNQLNNENLWNEPQFVISMNVKMILRNASKYFHRISVHFFTHFCAVHRFVPTHSDHKQIINESISENATDLSTWKSIINIV